MPSDEAISETVSVILVISLIVILFIITAALLFGNLSFQQKSAFVKAEIANQTLRTIDVFTLFHEAGDDFSLLNSSSGRNQLAIYIDNKTGSRRALPEPDLLIIKPGAVLYIYYSLSENAYVITQDPDIITITEARDIPDCPASVRVVDETAKILISTWNWSCDAKPQTGPAPTFNRVTTTYGYRGFPTTRTILGTNFLDGATVVFNLSNGVTGHPAEIAATSCAYVNSTMMNCTFTLPTDPLAPPSQLYHGVVINPDGKKGFRTNRFTVYSALPSLSSSTPATGLQDSTVTITRLRGNYFQPGATVVYRNDTTGTVMPMADVIVWNMTTITGTITIPADAPVTYYNITVQNPDKRNATLRNGFRVLSNTPTVTGLTNRTGYRGWTVYENITGTNFVSGTTAYLNGTGLDTIGGTCTYVSSTRLWCSFDLVGKTESATNGYNIVVHNPNGKEGMRAAYFTLSSPVPTYGSRTPTVGVQNVPVTINITGNYFQPGATVLYWQGTTTVLAVTGVNVPTRTIITGTLPIDATTPIGYYNITVMNTDGKMMVNRTNAFQIWAVAAPTISTVSPASGARKTDVLVTITGTNFVSKPTVYLYNGTTRIHTVPAANVTFISDTQLSARITVPSSVLPNYSNVRVTNPDTQYVIKNFAYQIV